MASPPRPNYGISRIDQPEKKNHGYYVRISHKGKSTQKFFPDKSSGGKAKALKAAREFRDSVLRKLPEQKQAYAAKKKRRIKKSGVVGVTHVVSSSPSGKVYHYWQAAWKEGKKRKTAKYSIERYGDKEALRLAKAALAKQKKS